MLSEKNPVFTEDYPALIEVTFNKLLTVDKKGLNSFCLIC